MTFIQTATNYGSGLLMLFAVLYLYDKYKQKEQQVEYYENQAIIGEYLLDSEFQDGKPFLWIPMTYESNTRHWKSFYDRRSTDLNQPYLDATVASIIQHNAKDFNICVIDDRSYGKLMDSWTISLVDVPDPIRSNLRNLALMKLVYMYGGLLVPPSFLCLGSLLPLYQQRSPMVAVEQRNRGSSSEYSLFTPSFSFMGADPKCPALQEGITRFEHMISRNHTHELEFWGQWNRWCYEQMEKNQLTCIDGTSVGVKRKNKEIPVDELLSDAHSYSLFHDVQYGIWFPQQEILSRTSFGWFSRMSLQQILDSDLAVSKFFALALGASV